MLNQDQIRVYGGTSNHVLDDMILELVKQRLGYNRLKYTHVTHSTWRDGEPGFRLNDFETIEGKTVIIFTSPADDKTELQLRGMVWACRQQYGAKRVIVVMSFLRYRRQEAEKKPQEIRRLYMFLQDLKHWGADHLILCEPHNVEKTAAYCREIGLALSIADPTGLFVDAIRPLLLSCELENVLLFSPDRGSVARAIAMAEKLNVPVVAQPKERINGRLVFSADPKKFQLELMERFHPKIPLSCDIRLVTGKHVVIRDDEIDSGGTAATQGWKLQEHGAHSVYLVSTHPVLSDGWRDTLFPYGEKPPFRQVFAGNTRRRGDWTRTDYEGSTGGELTVVSMAPVLAGQLVNLLESLED